MTNTLLVTPENWFDLPRLAATAGADTTLEFTLSATDGRQPLAAVSLGELRAVHHTFGAWWSHLGTDRRPASVPAGAYDRFLAESRALLRQQAEAAVDAHASLAGPPEALLAFPALAHPLLADSAGAAAFLRSFFALPHSPSLIAWARRIAAAGDACTTARRQEWLRLVLQKVAAEDPVPEVLDCLRLVYEGCDADRQRLLSAESRVLDQCGMTDHAGWARVLGLYTPARTAPALDVPPRRPARAVVTPDITVLVPSYCHEAYIEATLESVLAQTHAGFRILVVDDRSSDDTVERARRIDDPRLTVRVNAENLGLGTSVLGALDVIETPYVALLNSDDLFHPERLHRCLDALARSPRAHVVATGVVPIDAQGRRLTVDTISRLFDGSQIADWVQWYSDTGRVAPDSNLVAALLERNFLVTSSNIVARTDFLRSRAHTLRGLEYCLDWQVFLNAAAAGALVHLPDDLLGYRLHQTNTVWFDDARGAAYVLEVNRVLAEALRQLRPSASAARDDDAVAGVIDLLAKHAARHSHANGLAMYAHELAGSLRLDEAYDRSPAVQRSVRALADASQAGRAGQLATSVETVASAARAIAEIGREDATVARGTEHELHDAIRRERVDRERVEADFRSQGADFRSQEADLRSQVADLRSQEADLRCQVADLRSAIAGLEASVAGRTEDVAELRAQLEASAAAHKKAQEEANAHAAALGRMRVSPEWLVGDRLWNRAGGSRIGWPAVRALRTLRDVRNRWGLATGHLAQRLGLKRPRAIVAACWSFPIHSQTFVYQEMQALSWAGFSCKVFCCDTNARQELPAAFSGLWGKRLVMQTEWTANQRDLDHFRRTRPERVEALLARLGQATGLTREALLQESIVLTGFTFARHVELAGATYLHTYFFYDQSFLGLMAAYLLQIPRGITAYADHMLGDYAFKLVPLHLELADIVVATSRRIKTELGAIGGGRFDDKIVVKPNGIDVARFPPVDAATRLAAGGDPELIAVNRIEPKKGLIHLIDAMGLLKARGVPARLNLVGGADVHTPASAECYRQLVARIEELQLADRVVLHGVKQQHEFGPLVARSRVFVAPYVEVHTGDKDGIPTAVLEAMSSGLPIVHTDAGSIEEAAADGVEGITVPQRNAAALAEAIERLLTDRELFTRMSNAARHRAVTEFDIHVTERRLHERIRACLGRS